MQSHNSFNTERATDGGAIPYKKQRTERHGATWFRKWHTKLSGVEMEPREWGALMGSKYPFVDGTGHRMEQSGDSPTCVTRCDNLQNAVDDCKEAGFVFVDFGHDKIHGVDTKAVSQGTTMFSTSWDKFSDTVRDQGLHRMALGQDNKCTLTASQHPAGSGKTYRLCKDTIDDITRGDCHSVILFLTKAHAQKDTAIKQFEALLEKLKRESGVEFSSDAGNKKHTFEYDNRRVVFATIDSFIYNVTDDLVHAPNLFSSLVETICEHYPTKIRNGHFSFAGRHVRADGRMLVIVDEATLIQESYVEALMKIMESHSIDVTLSGDVLQSTYFAKNALVYLLHRPELPKGVTLKKDGDVKIRRFGRSLVDVRNKIMTGCEGETNLLDIEPKVGTPIPAEGVHTLQGDYSAHLLPMKSTKTDDGERMAERVRVVMEKLRNDIIAFEYLPEDILIMSPFVSHTTDLGQMMDLLMQEMEQMWTDLSHDDTYKHSLLIKERLTKQAWLCHLHRSQEEGSIQLKKSEKRVRLVSIHSAQGDGRKCAYAIGLSESALIHFSGEINGKYASLVNVAITRMEQVLRVFIEPYVDDIYRRFDIQTKQPDDTFPDKLPSLSKIVKLKDLEADQIEQEHLYKALRKRLEEHGCSQGTGSTGNVVDQHHHLIRMGAMHSILCAKILVHDESKQVHTVLKKIQRKRVMPFVSKQYFKEVKDVTKSDDGPIPVLMFEGNCGPRDDLQKSLIKHIKSVQARILTWFKAKRDSDLFHNMTAIEMVVFHHLMCLHSKGRHHELGPRDVYDIISNEEALNAHYSDLSKLSDKINPHMGLPGNKWILYRSIWLGRDNKDTQLSDDVMFNANLPYATFNDSHFTVVVPCVSLDQLRLPQHCATVLTLTMCCMWPDRTNEDTYETNDTSEYITKDQKKRVCFMPYFSDQKDVTVDISDLVEEHRSHVLTTLVNLTRSKMERAKRDVGRLIKHFEIQKVYETLKHLESQKKHRRPFPFLLAAMKGAIKKKGLKSLEDKRSEVQKQLDLKMEEALENLSFDDDCDFFD